MTYVIVWTGDRDGREAPQILEIADRDAMIAAVRRKHYAEEHILEVRDDSGTIYRLADLLGPGGL